MFRRRSAHAARSVKQAVFSPLRQQRMAITSQYHQQLLTVPAAAISPMNTFARLASFFRSALRHPPVHLSGPRGCNHPPPPHPRVQSRLHPTPTRACIPHPKLVCHSAISSNGISGCSANNFHVHSWNKNVCACLRRILVLNQSRGNLIGA